VDFQLLLLYSAAVFAAGLLGGWLPRRVEMTHTRTQLTMSFVAGLMLGVAFFHLIPHSALGRGAEGIDFTMLWVVAGLIFMLLLLRLFHFHQHDFGATLEQCQHGDADHHDHRDAHDHAHPPTGSATWVGLLFGLSIHTVVDGIALGAVMGAEPSSGAGILGLGVFLAILLHKPLDSLSIETVMAVAAAPLAQRRLVNVGFSLLAPLAALLFWSAVDPLDPSNLLLPAALAFSAGAFICIALGDLLPEIQFHSHDRVKLTWVLLVGIAMAWAIGMVESGHGGGLH